MKISRVVHRRVPELTTIYGVLRKQTTVSPALAKLRGHAMNTNRMRDGVQQQQQDVIGIRSFPIAIAVGKRPSERGREETRLRDEAHSGR